MAGQRNGYGKRPHSHSEFSEEGSYKRRHSGHDKESFTIGPDDTVYRYLCPGKKIGSVIGRGGDIIKKLREETKSKIRIGETVRGCEERVVTVYSSSQETNEFDGSDDCVCPAQDALFKVHDRVVADGMDVDEDPEGSQQITVKLLVSSDQIGCIIGKGGQIVQNIRTESGAQVRILKDNHLPACALTSDELVQISGESSTVRKALYQIATRLHDNPSRSQHLLASSVPNIMFSSLVGGPYDGYNGESRERSRSRSMYPPQRNDSSSKEFSLRLVCPTANIGGVIGKGGAIINQIRQESRANIKVDSSNSEGDDCIISISSNEFFEDTFSPTVEAALHLQPRCSETPEKDSGLISSTTRILVPTSRIGCLIGKGGSIISEIRRITRANIRILSKDDLPKVAASDEEMVQITGDRDVSKDALIQVTSRLRANLFEREGALPALVPVLPYLPMSADATESLKYDNRDADRHGRGSSYGYGGRNDLPPVDTYGNYGGVRDGNNRSPYGSYGGYAPGRSSSSGLPGQNPVSRGRSYDY